MFENRIQISRPSGVDGLVCDAGIHPDMSTTPGIRILYELQ